MAVDIAPALAEIVARAYTTGVETSIEKLSELLDLGQVGRLSAAIKVVEFMEMFHLELAPSPMEGEFGSVRVLRSKLSSTDPLNNMRQLLLQGEGPSVEFKSSMFCSIRDWQTSGKRLEIQALQGEILKTVCAFLNTDGGDLFVGVDDDGHSCGGLQLDLELKKWSLDKWQLHFQALISGLFQDGGQVQPFLRGTMMEIDALPVFHVSVMPRRTRSFVRRAKGQPYEYFVRNGPRTDSLDLPNFYAHLSSYLDS
ncbi:helix-turn-helix domain-containing protein [Arthrobacter sp. NyZ413]|uniref:AlbA family DNA-binding domain-containing protein n=1 Tax=Arthrobacter sp. NyZ413 TaxID=3144669 RepID=UPI003BF8F040